jgi:hypothetical protein
MEGVRGSNPLSSTAGQRPVSSNGQTVVGLGAAAKCSNGAHVPSQFPSLLSASRVGLVGIYSNPRHVAAYDDGEVRQEFSICLAGRLLGGSVRTSSESSEVRFVPAADLPSYEIHLSIWMRISHYLEGRTAPYIS